MNNIILYNNITDSLTYHYDDDGGDGDDDDGD